MEKVSVAAFYFVMIPALVFIASSLAHGGLWPSQSFQLLNIQEASACGFNTKTVFHLVNDVSINAPPARNIFYRRDAKLQRRREMQ